MDIEQRRAIVRELLDSYGSKSQDAMRLLKDEKTPTGEFVYKQLRTYMLAKLLLPPDTDGQDIENLIAESISRIEKIDSSILDELQNKRPCNYMTAVSTKKVMLYYALKSELGAPIKATDMVSQKTIEGLARVVANALNAA